MIEHILGSVSSFIVNTVDAAGYGGIFVLMALEGSFFPLPSEIILPFSGFLAAEGRFSIWMIALVGAVGNIVGTLFSYTVARYVGLPFLYKFGKFVLVTRHDIDLAHRLFERFGVRILFISRLIPGIRGFIPIPAGVAKMNVLPFVLYVFVGSFLYSLVLTYIGFLIGENWNIVSHYAKPFKYVLIFAIIGGGIWWIRRYIREVRK
jgi:membrane protein DedA with SNARE-associated domain